MESGEGEGCQNFMLKGYYSSFGCGLRKKMKKKWEKAYGHIQIVSSSEGVKNPVLGSGPTLEIAL